MFNWGSRDKVTNWDNGSGSDKWETRSGLNNLESGIGLDKWEVRSGLTLGNKWDGLAKETDLGLDLGWVSRRLRLGRLLGTTGVVGKIWLL